MKKLVVVTVLALAAIAAAQDSLNCRFIGNRPFGSSYAVAPDAGRSLAFMGSGGGVYMLDVSNPASPQKLSEAVRTRGIVSGLAYLSNRLYVAASGAGLEIWDVSAPASPSFLGRLNTPGYALGVAVSGSYAYVADGDSGLRIIDVTNRQSPSEAGYCDTPDSACGVAVSGSYACVADDVAGLLVIEFYGTGIEETPSADVRARNTDPTVVHGVLMMGRQLTADGSRQELLDAVGRRVMALRAGVNDASSLAPGVYFVQSPIVNRQSRGLSSQDREDA